MLQPTFSVSDYSELQIAYDAGKLAGSLLEVPVFGKDETFLLNLTDTCQIGDGEVEEFYEHLSQVALHILREELSEIASEWLFNPNVGRFVFKDAKDGSPASEILGRAAKLSPHIKIKGVGGYLRSLEEPDYQVALDQIINEVTSQKNWVDQLHPSVLPKLSVNALPALLLSRWEHYQKMQLGKFYNLLVVIMETCDKKNRQKVKDRPPIAACGIDVLIFSPGHLKNTQRRLSSGVRKFAQSLIALGREKKLWLPSRPPKGRTVKGDIFLCSDILSAFDAYYKDNTSTKSVMASCWRRFSYMSSGWDAHRIPIGIGLLIKLAIPNYKVGRLGVKGLIRHLNKSRIREYPELMTRGRAMSQIGPWPEQLRLIITPDGTRYIATPAWSRKPIGAVTTPLGKKWVEFFSEYNSALTASDAHKRSAAREFAKWAIAERGFDDPWSIQPIDLMSAAFSEPGKVTYFEFINSRNISKSTKAGHWSGPCKMYRVVCNRRALDSTPKANPFAHLPEPNFSGRKKRRKTHRKRITQPIVERMTEILLCEDSSGRPTYAWAKEISRSHLGSVTHGRSDHYRISKNEELFCPSRAAALSLLLLLPLRGVQVRWLDEGLADEELFDPETLSFRRNNSALVRQKNEFGTTFQQLVGSAGGVIQKSNSLLAENDELCIYVNTNKTKIWDPEEYNGYSIPWPFFRFPQTLSERRLNRPYRVILEQMRWMREHDPNPTLLRFDHVPADAARLTDAGNVVANAPFIAPLFRDTATKISFERNGQWENASPPISKEKLKKLFDELCAETEKQLRSEGQEVTLTKRGPDGSRVSVFDIHSLRVAGISSLIEMGVPVHIVSEFVAGHLSVAMTMGYYKTTSATAREKVIEANQAASGGMEKAIDFAGDIDLIQPIVSRDEDVIAKHNVATFAPVEGGLCPIGGKGCPGCQTGMLVERGCNSKEELVTEYQRVIGGCGNCRFWMTGPDFLGEQVLELNRLMLQMRESSKEISQLTGELEDLQWDLEECQDAEKRKRIIKRIANLEASITGRKEDLLPFMTAWSNRYTAIQKSIELLEASQNSCDDKAITLIADSPNLVLETVSEFELVRTTIEQARLLPRDVVPIPEQPASMLRGFMDTILSNAGSANLFGRIPDKLVATTGASRLANLLAERLSDEDINNLLYKPESALPDGLAVFLDETAREITCEPARRSRVKKNGGLAIREAL